MKYQFTALLLAGLLLTSCAENPSTDIVVHKDMERVIAAAQQTDGEKQDIEELQQYQTYTAEIANESLRVTVHADAKVDVPQTDRLSVFRVKQHEFTQEDIDNVRRVLLGDVPVYDGIASNTRTKAVIEQEIAYLRGIMEDEIQDQPTEESRAAVEADILSEIDGLRAEYEAAPEKPDMIPTDGKWMDVAEKLASGENADYWQWQSGLSGKLVADLRNADNTAVLYAQNNPDFSNKICFSTSPCGPEHTGGVVVELDELVTLERAGLPEHFLDYGWYIDDPDSAAPEQMPGDSCTLSRAEAQSEAEAVLAALGIEGFACASADKYAEMLRTEELRYYRTCWILRYYRCIGGVMFDQASGSKENFGWEGEQYRKQFWPGEAVELHISDAGVVRFTWNAPLEITETVVEETALKPFPEICSTFERMMPILAAVPEEAFEPAEIGIDRVTLTYSRISEKDSFDTGLIVPVWGFLGWKRNENSHSKEPYVQMAVNAIDGSVIDSGLGY